MGVHLMGKFRQSPLERKARIMGILAHSGPCTVKHLADITRVSLMATAEDVAELRMAEKIEPVSRVDGALAYRVAGS